MKRLSIVGLLLILFTFTLTECKKNNDIQPQNPSFNNSGTNNSGNKNSYNKSDTTVSLQNGRITIAIPAGAMKEGTKVSIGSSNVTFVDTADQLHQFTLNPAGTQFKKPVTLTFHYDSSWLKGNSPWNIGIAYKDEKDGKWYPAVNGEVDTVKHTISIKTTHFSHWSIYTCFHLYMKGGGKLSEDNGKLIRLYTGATGLLMLTMVEPPAWRSDPDKSKEFSDPLFAPLTPPVLDPKESYSKSLAPDEWDVNGIANGDEHVGIIRPVSGASEKLYEYTAPPQIPQNNPVGVSAIINTKNHGEILLGQAVEIVGKWKLSFQLKGVVSCNGNDGFSWIETYSNAVYFHIDKDLNIVYDNNSYQPVAVSNFGSCNACLKITSFNVNDFFVKISGIKGSFDPNTDSLYCNLAYTGNDGTISATDKDVCDNTSGSGFRLPVPNSHSNGKITLLLKNGFTKDTTIEKQIGPELIKTTTSIKLESMQ